MFEPQNTLDLVRARMASTGTSGVRFFLSAALCPRVQAPSRWVAVNASSRKAFTVSGKDSGSPFLRFLATGRAGEDRASFDAAAKSLGVDETISATNFLNWYRHLNHGYPFLDYSKHETRAIDAELMESYAAAGQAPPLVTDRQGDSRGLAPGRLQANGVPQEPTEELLAGWLRASAGFTQLRQLAHSAVGFRTSPSGGARHPTDLGVHVGKAWPAKLAGRWWYDPIAHGLVAAETKLTAEPSGLPPTAVTFVVSSHVRRAMWRYRDIRAFRPVVIDAGHVVETLLSAVAYCGWTGWWQPAAGFVEAAGEFDPVFGFVVATPDGCAPAAHDGLLTTRRSVAREPWRTNPLISLTATGRGVIGENHLASGSPLPLSAAMIDALAYAIPSSRCDRPTATADLLSRHDVTRRDLDALVGAGFLMSDTEGDRLWRLARTWSEHDWFLSLLAHACEAADSAAARPPLAEPVSYRSTSLPRALDLRRTSRSLLDSPLPERTATESLAALATPCRGIRIVLSTRHQLADLESGTYLLHDGVYDLQTPLVPSEEEVTAAAIGQPWARQFSCIAWLIPDPDARPGSWEAALVECGRMAQRLTLAVCDEPNIGVFQSPALLDDKLADLLTVHTSIDGAYMVGLGITDEILGNETARTFRPSSLFVPRKA